ncbi:MAG: DNA-protecting protein DprA, partial [Firmicutes bacterium]|nr:DNA-protecting protein DprA [Bacillota bacterium]
VLGCGPDVVYPRDNRRLMEQIAGSGAVVSEFPPGVPPEAWHFPLRNRIISGLSRVVLVVEAAEKSGALITADFALEQGRDVMAVPGNITSPASRGANRLIKQGAKLVEDAGDVLEELGLGASLFPRAEPDPGPRHKLGPEEERVFRLLSVEPVHLDELVERTGLSAREVQIAVMYLMTKGLAAKLAGDKYTCTTKNMF